jgi:hypothetical protein
VRCWQTTTSCEFKDRALFADCSELPVAGFCEGGSEGWEYLSWLSAYRDSRRDCPHLGSSSNRTVNCISTKVRFLLDILYELQKEC